ncbi:MAG TPA: hypothetical protein VK933_17845 [Longimicrobiales bacterium]|nr:hypothetical protein [Longimicrobiales bacterium]
MMKRRYMLPPLMAALAWAASAPSVEAQTVTATAGARYDADGVVRTLAGANWRDLWTTPVRVPVLNLDTTAGGLTPERTGGRQSKTLHFQGADGHLYIFRSVEKFLHGEALPAALRNTPVGDVVQDQISMLLPAAGLMVGPLYEAAGLLHPWPTLVVMPDDPKLGEFREEYAGMLGQFEENPQEGPDDTPGFAGSSKLVGVDKLLERLDETSEHRPDAAEYLAARLIQFMLADTDRGGDQWRFAEFDNPAGPGSIWRPVARDHDFAFMKPEGLMGWISLMAWPKLAHFDATFEPLAALTYMTRDMDRRLLVELPRERWDSVVTALQTQLTDDVLRAAAGRLPDEWEPRAADELFSGLQARRQGLRDVAAEFFAMVSHEADVHATAEDELAEVERLADGSVEVRLYGPDAVAGGRVAAVSPSPPTEGVERSSGAPGAAPWFQRRFVPSETREIRLYMLGGDDAVRVTGSAPHSIRVRVIGGGGDDLLVDSSAVAQGGWATRFYTAHGDDRVVRGAGTRIDTRSFDEVLPGRPLDMAEQAPDPDEESEDDEEEDVADDEAAGAEDPGLEEAVTDRLQRPAYRDWGRTSGLRPAVDYRSGPGLLIGAGAGLTRYGFRRDDYKYRLDAQALYSVDTGGFGVELFGDYHPENTHLGLSLDASATQFETFRFFGYGNDTDQLEGVSARVYRDQLTVRPAVYWATESTYFGVGPIVRYGSPNYEDGSPMALLQPMGVDAFAQAGGAAELRIDRGDHVGADARGYSLHAGATAYPALLDVTDAFGSTHAVARAWVPLGWPFLALRAGGRKLWGGFPVHEAAFLGGRTSLRGFETDRFAGDASVFGSTELHAPLGTIELLVRGELGVFGLADAGRVYFDGESPGGWHTSYGGGVWFSSLGHALSLAYAKGETGRLYLRLGMPL